MVDFIHDKLLGPGTWYLWKTGKRRIFVACAKCAHIIMVDEDENEITTEGVIVEQVICPHWGCTFNDQVKLIGWDPNLLQPGVG
jgi:hypothetical protein